MENENHILFDQFKNGELSTSEKKTFEDRLKNDAIFKQEYLLYLALVTGIKESGKANIVADINSASKGTSPKSYNPPSGGGFGFFHALSLVIMAGVVSVILLYTDVIPSKNEKVKEAKEWLHQWDELIQLQLITDTIYDTVYHYQRIEDPNIEVGDTIYME